MRVSLFATLFSLLLAFEAYGVELVHLKNGFTLEAESHTLLDGTLELHMGGGTVTVAESEIGSIEAVSRPGQAARDKTEASALPDQLLADAAQAYGIDPAFVRSVAQIESGLRQAAISPKGAIGLMQLMPETAADLHVDPKEASGNASGGARYLRELLLRYHGDSVRALAAYNAGPGAVQKYNGAPPYEETRRYIVKVLAEYKKQLRANGPAANNVSRKPGSRPSKPSATD
jgi:soluble lytic murein transglycosylase-like protein